MWLPSTRTMPKPRLAAPGSIPITTCMGSDSGTRSLGCLPSAALATAQATSGLSSVSELLEHVLGDVEVGVDLVDVVVLVERRRAASAAARPRCP